MKSGRRTTAFYVETLFLTLFLLLVLTVLVRVFSAARSMGTEARQITEATLIARNTAAEFSAGTTPLPADPVRVREDGTVDRSGDYLVTVTSSGTQKAAGNMTTAKIEVRAAAKGKDSKPLCSLKTEKYIPGR